ncbi:MAG: pilus assembly protein PilZ [Treponema sp.]|nr:pilus assembly protein PilZ [Treponema sp.]
MEMGKGEPSFTLLGRKIFFLNPLPAVQNAVIDELIQREYEAYVVSDRTVLRRALKDFPGSMVFVDIDQTITEKDWESWIRELLKAPDLEDIRIGILTSNRSDLLQNKYANMLKLPGGYTMIHRDLNITVAQILNILNANEAKGRRKYLRAATEKDGQTLVNFPMEGRFLSGTLGDISTAGCSCFFTDDPEFPQNASFSNVQIKLKHTIIHVEVVILGSRLEGKTRIYVALFSDRISPDTQVKIRKYIQTNLQSRMDAVLG